MTGDGDDADAAGAAGWHHGPALSHGPDGVLVVACEDGWEVYPCGEDGGAAARCATRTEALALAEAIAAAATCCADRD